MSKVLYCKLISILNMNFSPFLSAAFHWKPSKSKERPSGRFNIILIRRMRCHTGRSRVWNFKWASLSHKCLPVGNLKYLHSWLLYMAIALISINKDQRHIMDIQKIINFTTKFTIIAVPILHLTLKSTKLMNNIVSLAPQLPIKEVIDRFHRI